MLPIDSQEAVFRFLADPRTHGSERAGRARRYRQRPRISCRPRRLQSQAGGQVPVHGSVDAGQAPRGLRGGDRRQPAVGARHLSVGAADHPTAAETLRSAAMAKSSSGSTHMRRFDENATLDRVADREGMPDAIIDKLALAIRRSHARAPLRDASAPRMRSRLISSRTTPLSPSGPISSTRPAARKLDSRFAARVRDRAPGPAQAG